MGSVTFSHTKHGSWLSAEDRSIDPLVSADSEWSTLHSVIVGRAEHSCFPDEPRQMVDATMPSKYRHLFHANSPFPAEIVRLASLELDGLCKLLRREGVQVHRAEEVDWALAKGYTAAMPRDALLVVGNTIIESCFAWQCRAREVELSLGSLLSNLEKCRSNQIVRAPLNPNPTSIYRDIAGYGRNQFAINNSRPAFDAADFMRFGKTIIAQLSNVTNTMGIQYVQSRLPQGYKVELLKVTDPHALHIDATLLPLKNGLLVYNSERVAPEALRQHSVFTNWELVAYPFAQQIKLREAKEDEVPRFMTSAWIAMNILVLGKNRVIVEELDADFATWLEERDMTVFRLPFRHVHALGGSFHCATVDLNRCPG